MASVFPLRELMLICKGCGGERLVPQEELDRIRSVDDFENFTKSRIALYRCPCGAPRCDIRMRVSEEAEKEMKDGDHAT